LDIAGLEGDHQRRILMVC